MVEYSTEFILSEDGIPWSVLEVCSGWRAAVVVGVSGVDWHGRVDCILLKACI